MGLKPILAPLVWDASITQIMPQYTQKEKDWAETRGYTAQSTGRLQGEDGRLLLPAANQWKVLKTLHQTFHWERDKPLQMAQRLFTGRDLQKTIQHILTACEICHKNSPLTYPQTPIGVQRQSRWPGEDWQLDFTRMPKAKRYKYLLAWIDTFTHWVEALPCRQKRH